MIHANIKPVVVKEFRQISRDTRTLGVLLFIPAFMLIMFGYALNFDVKNIPLAVYDDDNSAYSREYVRNFYNSEYFDLRYHLSNKDEIDALMGDEKIRAAIVIPGDFGSRLLGGREATVQIIVDGSNSNDAATIVGYIYGMNYDFSRKLLAKASMRLGKGKAVTLIDFRPRIWFNPELKSAMFLVPGLIGFIMMITAVISTALSIVREKEKGSMEQIAVSPIEPVEMIIGKVIPYIALSLITIIIILIVSHLLFDVTVKGSLPLLFLVTFIFLTGCLGLGLLISTIAETQQVAFMMSALITLLPTFILSGFVFPIRNMPVVIQALTYLVPAKYYLIALRAIILKGVGIAAFWEQVAFMIGFAVLTLGLSSLRMRKIEI